MVCGSGATNESKIIKFNMDLYYYHYVERVDA